MTVLMSGQPPKCQENLNICIKKRLFILALTCIVAETGGDARGVRAGVLEANVQCLGSSNRVRELVNEADF